MVGECAMGMTRIGLGKGLVLCPLFRIPLIVSC